MGNIFINIRPRIMLKHQHPIVVILGCTGTGKSKLAIELAKQFNGEIISADSMQVYKGLDIITNKVTSQEQEEIKHHCINFVDPLSRYTVVDFRNQCLPIIQQLLTDKKLPIIVGGTNYYIESLLWEVLIKPEDIKGKLLYEIDEDTSNSILAESNIDFLNAETLLKYKITQNSLDSISSSVLYKCLQEVDPAIANAHHPEDRRKIIRSLQVYQQTGCRHSELLEKQRNQKGGSSLGGPLRFKNTIMLWIQCGKEILNKRLDDRVDQMIDRGLLTELIDFHKSYNETRKNGKYTEGIFQSIGFKEFHNYLILPEEMRYKEEGKKTLETGIEEMKLVTRQYANKQTKWINNRFLKKPEREVPPVYGLQATDLDKWEETVLNPAIEIVSSAIQGTKPAMKPLPVEEGIQHIAETHYCDVCQRVFVGRNIWKLHLESKRHSKRKASIRKQELKQERARKKMKEMSDLEVKEDLINKNSES